MTGELCIVRWDKVVHVMRGPLPENSRIGPGGNLLGFSFPATLLCGRKAKMYTNGINRFTQQPVSCLVCLAGGYP